ncbi:MAG: glycosyltransferase family 4 protein [candidate division WOR-3 bacterium]
MIKWLVEQLKERGFTVEEIAIPLTWKTEKDIMKSYLQWRMTNLQEASEIPADIVIATKFPSYMVQHPRKIIWLFHQFRQIYDWAGTDLGYSCERVLQNDTRAKLIQLDNNAFNEASRIFTISRRVGSRLKKYNGFGSKVLYPFPPDKNNYKCIDYDDFLLHVGRLEKNKRADLIIEALGKSTRKMEIVFVGEGSERISLQKRAEELGIQKYTRFLGWVHKPELLDLYSRAAAVLFTAFDEDFGLVSTEAFLSRKPVIATSDSGGAIEIIEDGKTGIICDPNSDSLARCLEAALDKKPILKLMGENAFELISKWSWDVIIEKLTADDMMPLRRE